MSTFLVSLGVVGAAVVGVVLIALADPDQPATNHPPSRREGRHRRRVGALLTPPPPDPGAPSPSSAPGSELATDRSVARVRPLSEAPVRGNPVREARQPVQEARRPVREARRPIRPARRPAPGWLRLRSGMALVVLVAFVGLVLAALVGTTLALAAQALRHAVG